MHQPCVTMLTLPRRGPCGCFSGGSGWPTGGRLWRVQHPCSRALPAPTEAADDSCLHWKDSWASPVPRRVLPAWPMKSSLLPSHPMDGPRLRPGLQVSPCPPQHGALLQAPAQHPELKGCHLGVPHSRERAACALHSLTYQGTGDEFGGGSPVKCHGTVRTQTL